VLLYDALARREFRHPAARNSVTKNSSCCSSLSKDFVILLSLYRFWLIHLSDGRTDGQRDRIAIAYSPYACYCIMLLPAKKLDTRRHYQVWFSKHCQKVVIDSPAEIKNKKTALGLDRLANLTYIFSIYSHFLPRSFFSSFLLSHIPGLFLLFPKIQLRSIKNR